MKKNIKIFFIFTLIILTDRDCNSTSIVPDYASVKQLTIGINTEFTMPSPSAQQKGLAQNIPIEDGLTQCAFCVYFKGDNNKFLDKGMCTRLGKESTSLKGCGGYINWFDFGNNKYPNEYKKQICHNAGIGFID